MDKLSLEEIKELEEKATNIRKSILIALCNAGSGHTGGSLGMTDIFTYLFFKGMKNDPKNPKWDRRDRLVLSNGHICPVYYATLAHAGYFSIENFENNLRKFGSPFQGHPHREFLDILETSSGPLGEGLSQAVGIALAFKMNKDNYDKKVYCLLGDGELDEGQNWEAMMTASKYKLDNLVIIVDRNKVQLSGKTEEIMPLDSLYFKLESFNLNVVNIDGHNFEQIHNVIEEAKNIEGKPSVIIAHTIIAKGVKEWEGDYHWHGKAPNKEELALALEELDKI